MTKSYIVATLVAVAVLLMVNLFVFPLVFGSEAPMPYANLRDIPVYAAHGVALLATAILLVAICASASSTPQQSVRTSALAALLASLPTALHTFAMVDMSAGLLIAPIAWTVFSWTMAGSTVGVVLHGRKKAAAAST